MQILVSGETTAGQAFQFGLDVEVTNPDDVGEVTHSVGSIMQRAYQDNAYIEVIDIQYLVRRQFISCPKCGTPTPLGAGTTRCASKICGIDFRSKDWAPHVQKGSVINMIIPEQRSLSGGTVNQARVNPRAIAVWDVVRMDSRAYKTWCEVAKSAEEAETRIRAREAGIELAGEVGDAMGGV